MKKKIFAFLGLIWIIFGFSQTTTLNKYSPPQTVKDSEIRMLPGFHANSRDGNYNNGESFIATLGNKEDSQAPVTGYNPANGENYVYTRSYLYPVTESNAYAPQVQSITYFDGLGRPKQSIAIKSTPNGGDLVTPIVYDSFGRQRLDYLPVPTQGTTNGKIYVQTTHPSAPVPFPVADVNDYYKQEVIYSEKILENSPLDRVLEQYGVGSDWRNNSKKNVFDYQANGANEVLRFKTTTSWSNETNKITISDLSLDPNNLYYPASTLYKNMVKDEDNNTSYEYKNGQGQTILVRKELSATEKADTYYVYNEYDQLSYVISPLASEAIKNNTSIDLSSDGAIVSQLCYQYRYDGRNRLAAKRLPGKGYNSSTNQWIWEEMVYDKADRLILTRDANQNLENKWLLTKYDKFGRVAYTGILPRNQSRDILQGEAGNLVITEERSDSGFSKNGLQIYHTNNLFTDIETVLSVNYYDTYPAYSDLPSVGSSDQYGQKFLTQTYAPSESNSNTQLSTKGLPTASLVKTIGANTWTKTYMFYDQKGRSIYTESYNHLGGYTISSSQLDFSGVVQKTNMKHKRSSDSSSKEVVVNERFVYDFQNRLTEHYHKVDNNLEVLLAENRYDDLGRLINKKVGNELQSIDYDYNIRGWMTGINLIKNDPLKSLDVSKAFSYKIKYANPDNSSMGAAKYNGNIAEIDWTYGSNNKRRYGYQYDGLNRLLRANYQEFNLTTSSTPHYYDEALTYDLNGNIKTLNRFTKPRTGQSGTQIDKLKYYYENSDLSNKLHRITDNEGFPANTSGYPGGGGTMTYDANGNMKTMPDKGITQDILYNYLNLPTQIVQSGNPVNYVYRADGVKVSKLLVINDEHITTNYLDGFVYASKYSFAIDGALRVDDAVTRNMVSAGQEEAFLLEEKEPETNLTSGIGKIGLEFFPTSEGFYDYKNSKYIYQYKDHLGNVRLSYSRNSSTGGIKIEESNDYYPFGMNFVNSGLDVVDGETQFSPSATYKNYKYNGKELQETGMYDYGARFYMPDIGRWGVVDPKTELLESSSPYVYALNSPILYVDKDGELPIIINGKTMSDSERADVSYWTKAIINTIKGSGIPNPGGELHYVDGNRGWGASVSKVFASKANPTFPNDRRTGGRLAASDDWSSILGKLQRDPKTGKITEKIQIYTHSRGAAFGIGYTERLLQLIKENAKEFADPNNVIDYVLNMAPHQSDFLTAPEGVDSYSIDHSRDKLSDNDMSGVKAAFTTDEKSSGFFGAHSITSFQNDLKAFTSSFLKGGSSQNIINNFVDEMKKKYNITVTVRQ